MCLSIQSTTGPAAFVTVSALAAATVASCFAAATAVTTVATVAYAILGITCAGASAASVTAYFHEDSKNATAYFGKFRDHAGHTIAGAYTFVAQVLMQAVVQGIANGIETAFRRKIAGPDVTVGQR